MPFLVNLGMGGPGGGGFATRSLFKPLEKDFVVVSWDEPGTGQSYHAVPISKLTTQRFIDDAHALTLYLRDRFDQALGKPVRYGLPLLGMGYFISRNRFFMWVKVFN